jgi:hypothetical protein
MRHYVQSVGTDAGTVKSEPSRTPVEDLRRRVKRSVEGTDDAGAS